MMTVRAVAIPMLLLLHACGSGPPSPEEQFRRAVIDFNGHVVIMKSTSTFAEYREVIGVVREHEGVVAATPFLFVEGISSVRGKTAAIAVKGIAADEAAVGKRITPQGVFAEADDDEPTDFSSDEEPPDLSARDDADAQPKPSTLSAPVHAVIGVKLARELNVSVGDVVDFIIPPPIDYLTYQPKNEPPTRHAMRIVGMLETGAEYDERTMLTTFDALQAMVGRGDQAMGVEVRISDERAAARVAKALGERLGSPPYTVMDWCELNRAALKCEL